MSGTSCNFSGAVAVQKSVPSLLHSTYCICTLYTTATYLLVVCNLVYILLSNALHVFWGTDTIDLVYSYAWYGSPHLPVTPAQLMRPGIGQNTSCAVGDFALKLHLGLYYKGVVVRWLLMYAQHHTLRCCMCHCTSTAVITWPLTSSGSAKGGPCEKGQAPELSTIIEKSTAERKKTHALLASILTYICISM